MRLPDFHSHNPNSHILNLSTQEYRDYVPQTEGQLLTVGIHPWDTGRETFQDFGTLAEAISDHRVVAIGECGLDPLRGDNIDRQLYILHLILRNAEAADLPVVLHIVRRYDLILQLHREIKPKVAWAIHGFRGKPEVARELADAGIYMSLGTHFNIDSARVIPSNLLLVETDMDRPETLLTTIAEIARLRGTTPEAITKIASDNLRKFYRL